MSDSRPNSKTEDVASKTEPRETEHEDTSSKRGAEQPSPVPDQPESASNNAIPLERTATTDRPYSSFTSRQKAIIVLVATLGGCFSPFTTNIYFPAIDTISHALHVSISDVNLTITTYMIMQGVAPSFTSAIADDYGRRPAYVIGFVVYMCANLGLGLNKSYAGLLVLRCVQSAGSSGLVTLAQGTIADIVTSAERGKYIAITGLSGILAPTLAPIIGGVLAEHLGWHSVFWFLLILSAVYFVPLALFFPETCRSVVGDGSVEPPKWNRCLWDMIRRKKKSQEDEVEEGKASPPDNKQAEDQQAEKGATKRRRKVDIFGTLTIIRDPETAIILFYMGLIYAGFYAISTTLTVQFHAIYGLSSTLQGLLFIPQAVGSVCASLTNSRLLDGNYRRHARRAGVAVDRRKQVDLRDMPIERARLEIGMPVFAVGAVSIVVYGWLLQARVSIAGPIVMLFATGYTTLVGFSALNVLVIDLHRSRAATASAASNLVRCLLGAGASAVANPMIEALGNGWAFTLVGLVELAFLPVLLLVMKNGIQWREKRREKEKRREEEKRERETVERGD